jgi:hypothetical protein
MANLRRAINQAALVKSTDSLGNAYNTRARSHIRQRLSPGKRRFSYSVKYAKSRRLNNTRETTAGEGVNA